MKQTRISFFAALIATSFIASQTTTALEAAAGRGNDMSVLNGVNARIEAGDDAIMTVVNSILKCNNKMMTYNSDPAATGKDADDCTTTTGSSLWTDSGAGSIYYSGGNVGVGTLAPTLNAPGRVLHVSAAAGGASAIHLTNGNTGANANDGLILGRWNDGSNLLWTYENEPIYIATNSTINLAIRENGNVGVGLSNPTQKLDVNGKVVARQGIVFGDGTTMTTAPVTTAKPKISINYSTTVSCNNCGTNTSAWMTADYCSLQTAAYSFSTASAGCQVQLSGTDSWRVAATSNSSKNAATCRLVCFTLN